MDVAGKTVLVTGGASGLGRATVRSFVAKGANAIIVDVNDELGVALEKGTGRQSALSVQTSQAKQT